MKIKYQDMVSNWEEWTKSKIVPRIGEYVTIRHLKGLKKGKVLSVEYCHTKLLGDPAELTHVVITLDWNVR